jgi:hypothetical protein
VRDFSCPNCGQRLAFENSRCLQCGNDLGFDLAVRDFVILGTAGITVDEPARRRCGNTHVAVCNWLVSVEAPTTLCVSCALTRTRPAGHDLAALPLFGEAEAAKRRLVMELSELDLPITGRDADPENGLCFDLLSSARSRVVTGHFDGVVTLDLAESDDVHREQLRKSMDEPYRTLLGHFRHEIGHFYFSAIASIAEQRQELERLFGDPDSDYQDAMDRHYRSGAPIGWQDRYISSYASMHPAEDWAETFAHYLHIRDVIDTAAAFGFAPSGATADKPLAGNPGFERIIGLWLPLSWSLNMLNRSMGHTDLYPFVLPPPALEKINFVHNVITGG